MHYSIAISYCLIWEALWVPSSTGTQARHTRGVREEGEERISLGETQTRDTVQKEVWEGKVGGQRGFTGKESKSKADKRWAWCAKGKGLLYGNDYREMKKWVNESQRWHDIHMKMEGGDAGKWPMQSGRDGNRCMVGMFRGYDGGWREQQKMKETCQPEVAFDVGQEHKCRMIFPSPRQPFPHSLHSQLALSPPSPSALLSLLSPLLPPSLKSSATVNFTFRDKGRLWDTWRCRLLSYHGFTGHQEWRQDQDVFVHLCVPRVWRGVFLTASTCRSNGGLAGLPQPLIFLTTRFCWPSAAAQGHTPVPLIKAQTWHTHHTLRRHAHILQLKITLKGTSGAIIACTQHLLKIHSVLSAPGQNPPQSTGRSAANSIIKGAAFVPVWSSCNTGTAAPSLYDGTLLSVQLFAT